jgi:Na+/H+ antiporter NhaD/arsenite permease-like protein
MNTKVSAQKDTVRVSPANGLTQPAKSTQNTGIVPQNHDITTALQAVMHEIRNNALLYISLLAAVITSLFHAPRWEYIDAKVIVCLFELMLVVKALEQYGVLRNLAVSIANSCKTERGLAISLSLIAFFLSMLTTNDVAVLTIVPILLVIAKACDVSAVFPAVMITVAANLGSSLTPIGNPQNLYLFSFYHMSPAAFFRDAAPLCVAGLLALIASGRLVRPGKIELRLENTPIVEKKKVSVFLALTALVIAGVMNLIPYAATLAIVFPATLLLDRNLLRKPDYRLLLTFVFLFVAIGNISHIPALKERIMTMADTPMKTYLSAILFSQVISNVPSTIMLAPFTTQTQALFYGVNIGGLGTPIASLASIIGISLYTKAYPQGKARLMKNFMLYNVALLVLLGGVFALFVAYGPT